MIRQTNEMMLVFTLLLLLCMCSARDHLNLGPCALPLSYFPGPQYINFTESEATPHKTVFGAKQNAQYSSRRINEQKKIQRQSKINKSTEFPQLTMG